MIIYEDGDSDSANSNTMRVSFLSADQAIKHVLKNLALKKLITILSCHYNFSSLIVCTRKESFARIYFWNIFNTCENSHDQLY